MIFRRRRMARHRLAIVGVALLTYLVSVAPAAASVIYCISDDGHQGFELVASGDGGCASCCHDESGAAAAHEGFQPEHAECTDIALSDDQAVRSGTSTERDDTLSHPAVLPAAGVLDSTLVHRDFVSAPRAPARSSAAMLLRHTVLLI